MTTSDLLIRVVASGEFIGGSFHGKLLRFCIAGEYKNRWRNCIYHDKIGVFDKSEHLKDLVEITQGFWIISLRIIKKIIVHRSTLT